MTDQSISPQNKKFKKAKFSKAEDMLLKELVLANGTNNWAFIASRFTNRNVRQVKERWEYYLSPDVNNGPWTPEEDMLLLQKYNEFGSKWTAISHFFRGRTNTCCKNRFLAMKRQCEKESSSSSVSSNSGMASPVSDPVPPSEVEVSGSIESSFADLLFDDNLTNDILTVDSVFNADFCLW